MGESCESAVVAMEMVELGQNQPKIAPKRMEFQQIEKDREEDRITALPDCLLLEILSRLPSTKDAIKTGTLSKRWKHLWTLVPTLIFNFYDDNDPWPDIIDKTLTQCCQLKLKRFKVDINYKIQFESQVKNLIRFAVIRNVEELSLKLSIESEVELENYFFISSCFTDLTLEGCILNPTGTISWKNLRSLSMCFVKLDEHLIENILSGSPLLETLILDRCYGYRLLDITSKSVKELVYSGYNDPEDEYDERANIIEINAPNILSLTIRGNLLLGKLSLLNVSSVVEADIDYEHWWHWETIEKDEEDEILKGFIVNLRHVKELKIGSLCSKDLSRLEAKGFEFPSNMTFPSVTWDWSESESD